MPFFLMSKYTMSFNSCNIPSLSLPTRVIGAASGIPMGVLLWGVDDRELLGVGAALEKAMQ
jgi:Asp-tRNA(Asn)/Glu-tRNA(Gln) amidotransferase A subunit family amidase